MLTSVAALALAGCQGLGENSPFKKRPGAAAESGAASTSSVRLVERDVEAPEVFQVTDEGLWDGRPSLGGVWVASPEASDPERVIIRNEENGRFVIGALFRRERETPGPTLQVSSDAADALNMVAGSPDGAAGGRRAAACCRRSINAKRKAIPTGGVAFLPG